MNPYELGFTWGCIVGFGFLFAKLVHHIMFHTRHVNK